MRPVWLKPEFWAAFHTPQWMNGYFGYENYVSHRYGEEVEYETYEVEVENNGTTTTETRTREIRTPWERIDGFPAIPMDVYDGKMICAKLQT